MLRSLILENFTVFPRAELQFGEHLNVVVGENGTGKTHILKAAYCGIAASAERAGDELQKKIGSTALATTIGDKFLRVFRPDALGRLVRRGRGRGKGEICLRFDEAALDLAFTISTLSRVRITTTPRIPVSKRPVYIPTRELLTIAPGFVSLYETTHLPFEETWRDTCLLLQAPLVRGPREATSKKMLLPLEQAMGGKLDVDGAGRFYLNLVAGTMEVHLVAEGLRKLAMIARLIANGALTDKGYLFWDEPECNLNPKLIRVIARTIFNIAQSGIQVFVGSHSLFLLRELDILRSEFPSIDMQCFGLHPQPDNSIVVQQGNTMDDIGDITALDEELKQSDRYIEGELL